jgi:hypothetical protein
MPKITQIAISLQNKPGTLAKVCSTLSSAEVNISALLAPDAKGRGKVRFLVDRLDKAKEALNTAKIRFSEEEVIALNLDNRPGALAEVAEKLAQSKINIRYAYAATAEDSAKATVIVAVPDVDKALGVLGE